MADTTLFTATGSNNPLISGDLRREDVLIRQLAGTAYVGDIMVAVGESGDDVDQCADNEAGNEIGIILAPTIRPTDTWDADDILADNTWVEILRFGTMRYKVYMHINGQDTPVAGTDGDLVYSTSTDGSTNDSRDGSGTLNNTQGYAAVIGRLAGAFTTGNATSAANGTYAEVFI